MTGEDGGEAAPRIPRGLAAPGRAGRAVSALAVLAVGIVAFALARAALLPDVGLWDTAEYQTVLPLMGTLHPTGFPAYVLLGWLASIVLEPLGSPAFRMDLLSAVLLGVAVAGTAWLTLVLTGRRSLAVVAALGLAVTPIAWRIGTRADAHALHLAILPYLLLALVAWERRRCAVAEAAPHPDRPHEADGGAGPDSRAHGGAAPGGGAQPAPDRAADRLLLLAAALLGLGLADHRLIALLVPGIAAFVLVVEPGILRRRRFVATCIGVAILVTGLLYLELPLRAGPFPAPIVYGHPDTLLGFWYVFLGVQFGGTLVSSLSDPLRELASLVAMAVDQLGILAAALPAAAVIVVVHRPRYALLTVPAVLLTCLFAAGYADADIGRYYLGPALIVWTWLAVAAGWLLDVLAVERGWGVPVDRPASTAAAAELEDRPGVAALTRRTRRLGLVATALVSGLIVVATVPALPGRWAAVVADSAAASGRTWLDAALATMRQDSVVVSWWSYSTPLWYAQLVEGRRPDIRVVDDRTILDRGLGDVFSVIDANLGSRTVYAIRIDRAEIERMGRRYDITVIPLPDGPALMRIDGIKDPSA